MKIISISFSGSNPSMGPHNVHSTNSLSMENYPKELKDLLDNTTVNNIVTLREYLQLKKAGDKKELQKVEEANTDNLDLRSGGRIIDLIFYFDDQTQVQISDLRTWKIRGEGYTKFEALIREKGNVSQWSTEPPEPIIDDRDTFDRFTVKQVPFSVTEVESIELPLLKNEKESDD